MVIGETTQATGLTVPVQMRNGRMDYNTLYVPLAAETTDPLLLYLKDNRDAYGNLHCFVPEQANNSTAPSDPANLAIATIMTLGRDGYSPFSSSLQAARVLLYHLGEHSGAANKAAFLRDEYGVDHMEAEFAALPLPDELHQPYEMFTRATAINQRLREEEIPIDGPTWLDMTVLTTYQTLLGENQLPTSRQIQQLLPQDNTKLRLIEGSLRRLEEMGEITRGRTRRIEAPTKVAAEVLPDGSHVIVVKSEKPRTPQHRRKLATPITILTNLIA